jgi:hypothetical protein
VVQEALASGVPAVVTSEGGPKFVIDDGITGFAAATDAEFIARVVNLMEDAQLRKRMAAAARAATTRRTWDDVMSNVYSYYREICDSTAVEVTGRTRAEHLSRIPDPNPNPWNMPLRRPNRSSNQDAVSKALGKR